MEFDAKLTELVLNIQKACNNQFKYDLENNIPNKIAGVTFDNAAEHALESGLVHAIGQMIKWDTDKATKFAHHVLEDNNVHDVAGMIAGFIPEYNETTETN